MLISQACQNSDPGNQATDKIVADIRLGLPLQASSALVIVALEKGFFKKAGLEISVKQYPSGKRALKEGLITGDVDFIAVNETPFAIAAFENPDLRVLTSIFYSDNINRIIARNDRGIALPADLYNKSIATQRESAVDFFMYQFMSENRIDMESLDIHYLRAEELVDALQQGKVDALSMREPYISQAKASLQGQAVVFEESGIYSQVTLLVSRATYIENHQVVTERLVYALKLAEKYAEQHEASVIKIVANYIGADFRDLSRTWRESESRLQLNQMYINISEDIARWAIEQHLTKENARVPNYLDMLYPQPLRSVSPESVTLSVL